MPRLNLPALLPPVPSSKLQLNELHNGLLMCCAADGSVRIWRNYALRGQQRLASAWQSTLVPAPGSGARPAAYHWSPGYSALFAAGGRSAGVCACGRWEGAAVAVVLGFGWRWGPNSSWSHVLHLALSPAFVTCLCPTQSHAALQNEHVGH